MLAHGVGKHGFEQGRTFRVFDPPAADAATEDVGDDIETKIRPFHRPHRLGDIRRPDLIGSLGRQFGLLINRKAALTAALGDLTLGGENAIHCADRTRIDAFIKQRLIDFGRGLVGETRGPQLSKHMIAFTFRQGAR